MEDKKSSSAKEVFVWIIVFIIMIILFFSVFKQFTKKDDTGRSQLEHMFESVITFGEIETEVKQTGPTTLTAFYKVNSVDNLLHKGYLYGFKYDFFYTENDTFILDVFVKQNETHYVRIRDGLLLEKKRLDTEYQQMISFEEGQKGKERVERRTYYLFEKEFTVNKEEDIDKLSSFLKESVYWNKVSNDISKNENRGDSGGFIFPIIP